MGERKYGKLLTIILVVVVMGVLGLLIFLGIDIYKQITTKEEIKEALNKYDNMINGQFNVESSDEDDLVEEEVNIEFFNKEENKEIEEKPEEKPKPKPENNTIKHKGYNMVGKIEIPATRLKSPILEKTTPSSIEAAVAIMYSENGVNQVGNTVIAGHNYRNGSFFGNNDRLKIGDKIYITDNSGKRIEYKIYNIYETSPDDSDYIVRDTKGKREVSLTTCTNNSKGRLIIWAVER